MNVAEKELERLRQEEDGFNRRKTTPISPAFVRTTPNGRIYLSVDDIDLIAKLVTERANGTERRRIVDFLEKQLFRVPPVQDEVCHLTYDMWTDLKELILGGNL